MGKMNLDEFIWGGEENKIKFKRCLCGCICKCKYGKVENWIDRIKYLM